jgi:hypothetical protein
MFVSLDRFSQGLPDPQEAKAMAECVGCGGEIYKGEWVLVVGEDILHDRQDCLMQYVNPEPMTIEEALGVEP